MNKKILIFMICIMLLIPFKVQAGSYHILFKNESIELKNDEQLVGDTLYVPLREFLERFNADVVWNETEKSIVINVDKKLYYLKSNKPGIVYQGRLLDIACPVMKISGINYIPIRAALKVLNLELEYNAKLNRINIVSNQQVESNVSAPSDTNLKIMGESVATANQMANYLLKNNKNPKIPCTALELAKIYLEEGSKEGVRGDIAFAQSIKETGFFKFGGNVKSTQNNYAGMGSVKSGVKGSSFKTARIGVRAQIQHLKAYASKDSLNEDCVDKRFDLVKRGSATNLFELASALNPNESGWAYPGYNKYRHKSVIDAFNANETYGQKIYKILQKILNTK